MAERTAVLNLRLRPELRAAIDEDAAEQEVTASAVARRILAEHYTAKPRPR